MAGRTLGNGHRLLGYVLAVAGALLVMVGGVGIAVTGDMGYGIFAAVAALPTGLLVLLVGLDLVEKASRPGRDSLQVISLEEWLGTADVRRQSAKAFTN